MQWSSCANCSGHTCSGSSCPFAKLIFSIPPTHEEWSKAKWGRENDSAANQPLVLSPTGKEKTCPSPWWHTLPSWSALWWKTLHSITDIEREKKIFVGTLLLGKLDTGSVRLCRSRPWSITTHPLEAKAGTQC